MRILWFNWRCWLHPWAGGAEAHVREVAKRWVKWGHEVTLFCGKYRGCKEHDELDGVEIIRKGNPYTLYLCAIKEYLLNLRKRNYDAIIDDINGVPFFTPQYVKKPKVAIIHHLVKDIFFKELPWDKAVIGYAAERTISTIYRNTPFIAVSKSTKEDLIRFGIPEGNISVVYNGVDHELYKPNPGHKSPYPHVVYVGRIKQYKNLGQLLMAFRLVMNCLGREGDAIRLTVAGRGDCEELKGLARDLGISENVDFLGEISDEEKVKLLQSAWVYTTTSMREGWGLTAMEAMGCGTPIIGYNVPGIRDSVMNDKTGFLVPYGNVEKMAEVMIKTLTDEALRKKLSENAHRWSTNFNWDKTADELMGLIKNYC